MWWSRTEPMLSPRYAHVVLPLNPTTQHTSKQQKSTPYVTIKTPQQPSQGGLLQRKTALQHGCHEEDILGFHLPIWKLDFFSVWASFPTGARGCLNQPRNLSHIWLWRKWKHSPVNYLHKEGHTCSSQQHQRAVLISSFYPQNETFKFSKTDIGL